MGNRGSRAVLTTRVLPAVAPSQSHSLCWSLRGIEPTSCRIKVPVLPMGGRTSRWTGCHTEIGPRRSGRSASTVLSVWSRKPTSRTFTRAVRATRHSSARSPLTVRSIEADCPCVTATSLRCIVVGSPERSSLSFQATTSSCARASQSTHRPECSAIVGTQVTVTRTSASASTRSSNSAPVPVRSERRPSHSRIIARIVPPMSQRHARLFGAREERAAVDRLEPGTHTRASCAHRQTHRAAPWLRRLRAETPVDGSCW